MRRAATPRSPPSGFGAAAAITFTIGTFDLGVIAAGDGDGGGGLPRRHDHALARHAGARRRAARHDRPRVRHRHHRLQHRRHHWPYARRLVHGPWRAALDLLQLGVLHDADRAGGPGRRPAVAPAGRKAWHWHRRSNDDERTDQQRRRTDADRTGAARAARRQLRQPPGRHRHPRRSRRPHLGRQRQRVCRFPAGLRPDVHRPLPSRGDRGGAGADAARHHVLRQQRARHPARRRHRRCGGVRREGALRQSAAPRPMPTPCASPARSVAATRS